MSLEHFEIEHCEKIKFFFEGQNILCHLNEIDIYSCFNLVSFLDGGLLLTSLKELSICDFNKFKILLNHMHKLTSLQQSIIGECWPRIIFYFFFKRELPHLSIISNYLSRYCIDSHLLDISIFLMYFHICCFLKIKMGNWWCCQAECCKFSKFSIPIFEGLTKPLLCTWNNVY